MQKIHLNLIEAKRLVERRSDGYVRQLMSRSLRKMQNRDSELSAVEVSDIGIQIPHQWVPPVMSDIPCVGEATDDLKLPQPTRPLVKQSIASSWVDTVNVPHLEVPCSSGCQVLTRNSNSTNATVAWSRWQRALLSRRPRRSPQPQRQRQPQVQLQRGQLPRAQPQQQRHQQIVQPRHQQPVQPLRGQHLPQPQLRQFCISQSDASHSDASPTCPTRMVDAPFPIAVPKWRAVVGAIPSPPPPPVPTPPTTGTAARKSGGRRDAAQQKREIGLAKTAAEKVRRFGLICDTLHSCEKATIASLQQQQQLTQMQQRVQTEQLAQFHTQQAQQSQQQMALQMQQQAEHLAKQHQLQLSQQTEQLQQEHQLQLINKENSSSRHTHKSWTNQQELPPWGFLLHVILSRFPRTMDPGEDSCYKWHHGNSFGFWPYTLSAALARSIPADLRLFAATIGLATAITT